MTYTMETPVPWAKTRRGVENSLWSWHAKDVSIECRAHPNRYDKRANLVDRRDVAWTAETRRVTVSFLHHSGQRITVSEDRHESPADNLRVLYLCLDAMRLNEKRGFGDVMANAYLQLQGPAGESPWDVLGLEPGASTESIERRYRALAKRYHPDTGGTTEEFVNLQRAYEAVKQ